MIKVLIVEDEYLNTVHLKTLLQESSYDIQILEVIDSVKNLVPFLENNEVDLVFLDIHLSDGVSVDCFDKIGVGIPVIFTTAYGEYIADSFKVDNIGYLVKPIKAKELYESIEKFMSIKNVSLGEYKERFVIKYASRLLTIPVDKISFFHSNGGVAYINVFDNKKYIISDSLNKLEESLNPRMFFRVNRSYIVSMKAVSDIKSHANQRLELKVSDKDKVIVSRERVRKL